MKGVELYGRVRYAVQIEGMSCRAAARRFGIDPRTVSKMLSFSVPPGYRRSHPPVRPKLDAFLGIIERILEEEKSRPAKQRHTSKRTSCAGTPRRSAPGWPETRRASMTCCRRPTTRVTSSQGG